MEKIRRGMTIIEPMTEAFTELSDWCPAFTWSASNQAPDETGSLAKETTKPQLTTRFEDLVVALRRHAKGLYHVEAAVELLIGHQKWLCRNDFVDRFVRLVPGLTGDGVLAVVSWRAVVRALAAGRLPCSYGFRPNRRLTTRSLRSALLPVQSTSMSGRWKAISRHALTKFHTPHF